MSILDTSVEYLTDKLGTNVTADDIRKSVNDLKQYLPDLSPAQYNFKSDKFPEDLGSDYYGHWMTITAKVPTGSVSIPTGPFSDIARRMGATSDTSAYTAAIFIPGAGEGGSGIIYEDKHEYTDIKLTNLAGKALGTFYGGSIGSSETAGLATSMFGHPINPGVQVLYRSTNLRAFQFTFMMAPSSLKESESMDRIIFNLRRFAAPNASEGSFLFDTPAEFEIHFYNKNEENFKIPRIKRCVLTDINVNYTPQGEWSTFRNGYPVSCLLSLAFQEMEIITRNKIENGY